MKRLLGAWNRKFKVNEVGMKFRKKLENFLEIDVHLLNVF
jgi:hypothetical protein